MKATGIHNKDKSSYAANPRMQCSVCGRWKRLYGEDFENGGLYERFYAACGQNGEYEHVENVCHDCCLDKCPYRK